VIAIIKDKKILQNKTRPTSIRLISVPMFLNDSSRKASIASKTIF
jgi:hypothetical protein